MSALALPRKRFFYITSGTQLSETVSTFSAELQLPDAELYDRITLTQAAIPISYYVIQKGFNTFTLIEGATQTILTLTPGNYNANSFAVVVAVLLSTSSPNGLNYTITYPNSFTQVSTGKFTYTVNSSSITPIGFTFPIGSNIAAQFGFQLSSLGNITSPIFTPGSGTSTLISASVLDFIPENTVFIHSNLVQDAYTDVLQEIYSANTIPFQNLTFLNPDPYAYSKSLSSSKIRLATFSLTDEYNSPIFLNGLDVVLTICIYKEIDVLDKIERYIKYQVTKEMAQYE
jgi:hypothetical protein